MERPDLAGILSFEPRPSASSQSSSGLHDLTEAPLSANVTEVIDKKNLTIFGVWPLKKMERRPHLGPLFLTFFFVSIYPNDWWIYGKIRKLKENLDTFPKNYLKVILILWDTYSVTTSLLPSDVSMTIKMTKNFIYIIFSTCSVRSMINCAFNLVLSFQENSDNSKEWEGKSELL